MTKEIKLAEDLLKFIGESPSSFHVVKNVKDELMENGFVELDNKERWEIKKGGKYFVITNHSAIIAFVVGHGELENDGFKLIGAHTDSPTFRIKPNPEMVEEGSYLRLNTEVYGGPIINTWLDRPLSIAGRVVVKGKDVFKPEVHLLSIDKPLMIIPNLSIHMNRKVNEGIKLNTQKETLPLMAMVNEEFEKEGFLVKLLAKELDVNPEEIVDFELFLYEYEKGTIVGLNDEFISCGKLDDLAMCHAGLKGLLDSEVNKATNVLVLFDNEEVGSTTKQGAASPMLRNVLERICLSLGLDKEDYYRSIYNSFLISADLAHAVHPNYGEKQDPTNRPVINEGPAIKISSNQSYTTDSVSLTIYESICNKAEVPVQKFLNRSDERGGSTIGPISSTQLDIPSVDIGNPIFSMHSIRELGGVYDHYYIYKSFVEYYRY